MPIEQNKIKEECIVNKEYLKKIEHAMKKTEHDKDTATTSKGIKWEQILKQYKHFKPCKV